MRILLIWPKARTDPDWGGDLGAIAEPLSLEYLASGLFEDSHTVQVLDLRLHPEEFDSVLKTFVPDVVGVTAFSMHVRAALDIFKTAKTTLPSCWTVAGGHHATILPEDFFKPEVDFVVCGEGVRPLRRIIQQLGCGDAANHIPGVWKRNSDGGFDSGPPSETFLVDELPFPDRTITRHDRQRYFIDWMTPVALLRTSVGCPYRCTFCSLWKVMDGRYHKRSIDSVVKEVSTIPEDFVFLVDDEAFIDGPRMNALAQALRREDLVKRFFAYCRIYTLIRQIDVLKEWKKVGLERLFVGIDAISPKDLAEYNKRLSISQIEKGLSIAKDLGIEILAQFVVNTDYTRRDFSELERFVEHHKLDYPTFTILTPLPGTSLLAPDFSNVSRRQLNGRPDWDYFDTQSIVMPTKLPADEFRQLYRRLFRTFSGSYSSFLVHKPVNHGPLSRI